MPLFQSGRAAGGPNFAHLHLALLLKIAKVQNFEAPGGRTVVLGGIERPLQKWGILRISATNEDCPECIQLQHG